ncbi:MAG: carbohydrate ABC transporter substrate-binding protein [Treponema sp.]|nr:carbohydrate ABC transporter substrate-binding protein [Treponema sp.]
MKKYCLAAGLCAVVLSFLGCKEKSNSSQSENSKKKIVVWSYSNELGNMIDAPSFGYKATHPDVQVDYSLTPVDQFTSKLDRSLNCASGAPDLFALDVSFVRKYIEEGEELLLPLDDIYDQIKDKMDSYPVQVGSHDGHVYGLSWQVFPGAVFYRRSLAKRFFGTDDPEMVQQHLKDIRSFLDSAKLINEKSYGTVYIVSSSQDLFMPYKGLRKVHWITNGNLYIDPAMQSYMEMCRTMHVNHYSAGVQQWSEGWFAGMNDTLTDESGKNVQIFCYFLPAWGLHSVLKENAGNTAGDWAMVTGPVQYDCGRTWLAAYKGTKNPDAVKEMIRYLVSDDDFCTEYAKLTGDIVANIHTQDKIKNTFTEPFLGGQNHYAELCEMSKNTKESLVQGSDQAIEALWKEAVFSYAYGEKTKEEAIAGFRSHVKGTLGFDSWVIE